MLSNDFAKPWKFLAETFQSWCIIGDLRLWAEEAEDEEFSDVIGPNLKILERYSFQSGDTPAVMEITSKCMNIIADRNSCNDYINIALLSPNDALSECCKNYREKRVDLIRRLVKSGEWFAVQGGEEKFVGHVNPVVVGDKDRLLEARLRALGIEVRQANAILLRTIRRHVPEQYFVVLKAPFDLLLEQDDISNHPVVSYFWLGEEKPLDL